MKKILLPKISIVRARNFLLLAVALLVSFGIGFGLASNGYTVKLLKNSKNVPNVKISREIPRGKNVDFNLFWRVWDTVSESYFDKSKISPEKMVYGAIKGMVESLGDPYTVFLPPTENKVVNEDLSGNFEGIGIQIGFKGSQLAVIAPLIGSPAEKASIKAGDFIIGIKDTQKKIDRGTVGITLPEAVEAIRGTAGTSVTLALTRSGEDKPIVVDVRREKINVPSVILSFVGEKDSIAHIKLLKFGSETKAEWQETVNKILTKNNLTGIILDLRNNPGGYLQGAVDIASDFLTEGTVVSQQSANGEKNDFKVHMGQAKLAKFKLIVIVNGGSASASEILAGALRDDKKILLVGDTTFGKGTIQEPQDFENGAGMHITIAKWLTPSGFWVNEKGLEPDVKIKDDPKTEKIDEQLEEAIKEFSKND